MCVRETRQMRHIPVTTGRNASYDASYDASYNASDASYLLAQLLIMDNPQLLQLFPERPTPFTGVIPQRIKILLKIRLS